MTTPLILSLLVTVPVATVVMARALLGRQLGSFPAAAAVGLALVFAFTGVGHFVETEGMAAMLPEWVPARELAVQASGVFELLVSGLLLLPRTRRAAAWIAAGFLVAVLPINVWAAVHRTGLGGHLLGPSYLWIRIPLQLLLLAACLLAGRAAGPADAPR